jgi:hypothetical protein
MCMKNTPGNPCHSCGGCSQCTINRIDVNVGVPEPGQPGATLGSFGWNISTQPAVEEVTAVIDGVTRTGVCKQTYNAPNLTPCEGPGLVPVSLNAIFKTLDRTFAYDHWYATLPPVPLNHWFVGSINFQVWAFVQNAKIEVFRWGGLARTLLSGSVSHLATLQPSAGSRYRQYSSGCVNTFDQTYGTPLGSEMICGRSGLCFVLPFQGNQIQLTQAVSLPAFPINRDSGWVTGSCTALPTNDARTSPDTVFAAYNPLAAPGLCRIPSGSSLTTRASPISCNPPASNYFDTAFSYSTEDAWFARHPIAFS